MTSILTNSSALNALKTLQSIDKNLSQTQDRISSGMRIGSAADNASYWSIATTMKSDKDALSTVADSLGLGLAKVDTAYSALDSVKDLMSQIKTKLVAAQESGADKGKIGAEIKQLRDQIGTVAQSASFSGENWLYSGGASLGTKQLVGGFTRDSTGAVAVQTISVDAASSQLACKDTPSNGILSKGVQGLTATFYIIQATGATVPNNTTELSVTSSTTDGQLKDMQASLEKMLSSVVEQTATMGSLKNRLSMQTDFVKGLVQTLENGIGNLVDADMNEESTKLKALQTQQQLGIQALSIANNSAQNIMQLFR